MLSWLDHLRCWLAKDMAGVLGRESVAKRWGRRVCVCGVEEGLIGGSLGDNTVPSTTSLSYFFPKPPLLWAISVKQFFFELPGYLIFSHPLLWFTWELTPPPPFLFGPPLEHATVPVRYQLAWWYHHGWEQPALLWYHSAAWNLRSGVDGPIEHGYFCCLWTGCFFSQRKWVSTAKTANKIISTYINHHWENQVLTYKGPTSP